MVVSESGAQARRANNPDQAGVRGFATPLAVGTLVAAGWLLVGCSAQSSMNPVNWWHRQEGGKIAEERPAPPGADQPYPNISTVPAKPEAPDAEALKKLTDSLVADRTNAQHAAQSAPLADPSSPTASPGLFGVGTAQPPPPPGVNPPATTNPSTASGSPGTPVASASMPAVTAPPAPATPPSPAPRKAVQSTPLAPPPAETSPAATPPAATSVATTPSATSAPAPAPSAPPTATADAGTPPPLPNGPPSRPAVAPPPPPSPVAPTPMPAPSVGPSATIVFLEGASNLSAPAADEVKAFAAKRGNGTIAVTGYGDSASNDPDAQSAALNLGLSRAQSIVDALKADGVPGTAIRVSAEASGRGASLHLLQ
jgi:outer membrane protein OmpA-like peptidoglycan-associated protein